MLVMNKLLSIIIPAYNVQSYIQKCIDSCFSQDIDISLYELLIINDGSTDSTLDIIEESAQKYSNIRIFSQKNGGLSAARNVGIVNAEGKYIWFIDSDDYIRSNVLKKLLSDLEKDNLDAIWFQWQRVDEKGMCLPHEKNWIRRDIATVVSGVDFLSSIFGMCFYAWAFIFKRELFFRYKFCFAEGILYEDIELIPRLLLKVERIRYTSLCAYNYLQRAGSILHSFNPKLLDSLLFIINEYDDMQCVVPIKCRDAFDEIKYSCIRLCISVLSMDDYASYRGEVFKMLNNNRFPVVFPRHRRSAIFFNLLWRIDEMFIIYIYKLLFFLRKCF